MFQNMNSGPSNKSPEEVILEGLKLQKGKEVEFIKRALLGTDNTSSIPVGAHIQGILDANIAIGRPVSLDNAQKFLSKITGVGKRDDGRFVFKTETSIYELCTALQPEFGNFGVVTGDLEKEGFTAFNSNHSSNQDAFAISKSRNLFAVSDGVGSRSESGAVARFITMKIAEEITDLNDLTPGWIEATLKELKADPGFLKKYKKTGTNIGDGGSATLAVVNRIGEGEFQAILLGDSPLYVINKQGEVVREYGTDTAGNTSTNGSIGIQPDGSIVIKGQPLQKIIKLDDGEKIIVGSDYLSDGLLEYDKKIEHEIDEREKWKREGGFYEFDGAYVAPSDLSDDQKRKNAGKFVAWNSGIEARLASMKNSLLLYKEAMQNPKEYLLKRNKEPKAVQQVAEWQKIASRSLKEFLDIKTGDEFYNKTTGPKAWKNDDATVVIINPTFTGSESKKEPSSDKGYF